MPDMVGWPLASAQGALANVGIKAAAPDFVNVPVGPVGSGDAPLRLPVKPGAVTAQFPVAGTRVDQSTVVRLAVAK
jgi:beta-lactam-binding protein with PASTA domain